jgi:hypothetical protein
VKTALIFFYAIASVFSCKAQDEYRPPTHNDQENKLYSWSLKATPSSLLDRFCPNIPVGMEYNFKEQFGAGLNLSIPVSGTKRFRNSNATHTFSRNTRTELYARYYFNPGHRKGQWFLGLEGFYKEQFFLANYISYEKGSYETYSSQNAQVRKFASGAAVYLGIRSNTAKHLYLEVYTGIGKKQVNTHIYADNATHTGDRGIGYFPKSAANEDEHDANRSKVYFPLALSLCYRF